MASWGRQICKLVIYCSCVGFALVLFGEYCLPLILDYVWHVPNSPSKSIEAILAHRIELKNLESELDQMLRATNHPVNDHGIPGQIEISKEYDEYFAAIEEYTKHYGELNEKDIMGFINTHKKISKNLDNYIERHLKLYEERTNFMANITQRVANVGEYSKSAWILMKNMDTLAELGIFLDLEQEKDDLDEISNSDLVQNRSEKDIKEDDACIAVLQELLAYMTEADELLKRMKLQVEKLNAQLNEEVYPPSNDNDSTVDVEQELEFFQSESKRLKSKMIKLHKNNQQLIGKTNWFITAATARVNALADKVLKKEAEVWMEELNQALAKIHEKAEKSGQLTEKLTLNMNLRIAPDLDKEASRNEL